MQPREQVRQFITDNFLFGQQNGIEDGDSFLGTGVIDSTGVLELISFLEETFGIKVEEEELTPDNLDSIQNVSAYVSRKIASVPVAQPDPLTATFAGGPA